MPPALTILERRALPDAANVERLRVETADGARTTVYAATYPSSVPVRFARLDPPTPVLEWAESEGVSDATNGGFFAKPDDVPLGEFVLESGDTGGVPFAAPWSNTRACLRLGAAGAEIGPRDRVVVAPGDQVLQAGPLLVDAGVPVVADEDPEGFATTQEEFDQDLTAERLPRMAIALTADADWLAVAVDGRGDDDAGLLLEELAELLATLGAASALNLDGGSSSALVAGGELRNTPRDDEGNDLDAAGPTTTAIVFDA